MFFIVIIAAAQCQSDKFIVPREIRSRMFREEPDGNLDNSLLRAFSASREKYTRCNRLKAAKIF